MCCVFSDCVVKISRVLFDSIMWRQCTSSSRGNWIIIIPSLRVYVAYSMIIGYSLRARYFIHYSVFIFPFFKGSCVNRSPYRTHCLFRPNLISVVGVLLVIWRLDSRCYTHHMFNDVGPTSDYVTKDYLNQWILVFIVRKYVISDSLNKWIQHAVEMACFISRHQTNDWETSE